MSDTYITQEPDVVAPATPPVDEGISASDAFSSAARRTAASVAPASPGAQTTAGIPRVTNKAQYDALAPNTEYLDPDGNLRRKPWQAKDASSYARIPEGESYLDPDGNIRRKPKFEGVDFTTQTLHDMAINDKEKKRALERNYPGKVKTNPSSGELYIEEDDGTMRKPGSGGMLNRAAATVVSAAAPTGLSILGAIGGAVGGSAVPVAGTIAGSAAGGLGGGVLGQAFNDLILGLTGVYDRTGVEEAAGLTKSGLMGAAGAGVGTGIAAVAPAVKGLVTAGSTAAPSIAAHVLGATPERLAQASEIAGKGYRVPPSAWAMESPYLHTAVETFDPKFRTQNVLKQDAERMMETEGGKVLDTIGVPKSGRRSLVNPEAAVSSEEAGAAMMQKARIDMLAQDEKLAQAAEVAKRAAQEDATNKTGLFKQGVDALREAERQSMEAAQKAINLGFDNIQGDVKKAMEVAKVGESGGDLWTGVATKLQETRRAIAKNASARYERWDSAYGHMVPDSTGLSTLADEVLTQLPEEFVKKHPDIVKSMANIATGENQPTLGQLHNLRSNLRSNVDYTDLTPGIREGVYKLFSGKVNEVIQARGGDATMREAAKVLNDIDAYYGKNMRTFKDRTIQSVVSAIEAGLPADPQLLANTILKEGRTDLTNKVRKMVGPNYWSAVKAADVQEMLDSSKSLIPGQIDGRKFVQQVLDRDRSNMLEAVHGKEMANRLRTQAQYVAMAEGKLDIPVNPNDTVTTLLQKAQQATAAAKAEAAADPMRVLQREVKNIDRDFQKQMASLRRTRREDQLGFLYDPTVGASEAADKILGDKDLIFAAATRFGENSAEFNMLRQVYAQRILQKTMRVGESLEKITPEVQRIMFPGASLDEMHTLAKNMDFLMDTKAFSGTGAGSSIAAQERVLNPWGAISGLGPLAKPIKWVPGMDALGRYMLTKYYAMLSDIATRPATLQWVARGLNGSPVDRDAVKAAIKSAMAKGAPIGAGVAEGLYQASPTVMEPPRRR